MCSNCEPRCAPRQVMTCGRSKDRAELATVHQSMFKHQSVEEVARWIVKGLEEQGICETPPVAEWTMEMKTEWRTRAKQLRNGCLELSAVAAQCG
jgi:hypothetical protein